MHRHSSSVPSQEVLQRLQQALGSSYTIERELGGGGMSRIFLARDVALGRSVVVKLLPPEYAAGVNGERFRREILLAARLQHPHIVPILSAGEMHGVSYYTMPFIDGESLRSRLMRGQGFAVSEVARILHDVVDALAYAHEHGVVHRDIKPDNILMSRQHAVITDFGVAKALCAAHHDTCASCDGQAGVEAGFAIGTPAYMAPEQAAADPGTDHRADLYGFGVLAYELLTGLPPFSGREPLELLAAHVAETPIPIRALRPEVHEGLAELAMRCLEKQPEMRPESAAAIRDELERMTSQAERLPASSPFLEFGSRIGRLAAAAIVAVLATGSSLLISQRDQGATRVAVADDSGRTRVPMVAPGLARSHWQVAPAPATVVELPAVAANEPSIVTKKSRMAKAGGGTGASRQTSKGDVRVELRSKHGVSSTTIASASRTDAELIAHARRMQAFEIMAGAEDGVLASASAIDSITVDRKKGAATVFVSEPTVPRTAAPPSGARRHAPDAGAAAAVTVPAPSVGAVPAPVAGRVISMYRVEDRARTDAECAEEKARIEKARLARLAGRVTS